MTNSSICPSFEYSSSRMPRPLPNSMPILLRLQCAILDMAICVKGCFHLIGTYTVLIAVHYLRRIQPIAPVVESSSRIRRCKY